MYNFVHQHRQACIGTRPHLALMNLSTRPTRRRKGAASMPIRWGLEIADEHGVETYIEANPRCMRNLDSGL
jgi:hypothetical protein